jgi:hypothetical protein
MPRKGEKMKFKHLFILFMIYILCAGIANAGFLIPIDTDGAYDGVVTLNPNFSFGGDTTTAVPSFPSTAFGLPLGDSLFGGNGVAQLDTFNICYISTLRSASDLL